MSINNCFPENFRQVLLKCCLVLLPLFFAACQSSQQLKTEQYFAEGYQLYTANCSNCHQPEGNGMANLYPPLVGSASIKNKALFACIIKNGMKDTILVAGKKFSRPMPANPKLTDLEIAEIISYVRMKWGEDSTLTPIEVVNKALQQCP